MQPTVDQLLDAAHRLLAEAVAEEGVPPALTARVAKAARLLRQAGRAWPDVVPFLIADNAATATLLADFAGELPGELADRVRGEAGVEAGADAAGGRALAERNRRLRALLAEAVPHLGADARRRVAGQLRRRLDEDPALRRPAARPPAERPA